MNVTVSTAPSVLPVDLADIKDHLQVEHDSDDTYIELLNSAATAAVESYIHRKLITQTITLDLDSNEAVSPITLPYPPVQSITSFSIYDVNGNTTAMASGTNYYTVGDDPMRIVSDNSGWTIQRKYGAARIVYVVGYGDSGNDVDTNILHAIKELVRHLWEDEVDDFDMIPNNVKFLLAPYKLLI